MDQIQLLVSAALKMMHDDETYITDYSSASSMLALYCHVPKQQAELAVQQALKILNDQESTSGKIGECTLQPHILVALIDGEIKC